MNSKTCYLTLLIIALCFSSAQAQEQDDANIDLVPADRSSEWLGLDKGDRVANAEWLLLPRVLPLYQMVGRGFAADDGDYLAQSAEELQTYYDLAMSYQYIESPQVRAQLQLAEGEGIIIESVKSDGLGQLAGFLAGDLVLRVDEIPVVTQYDLVCALTGKRGATTSVRVRRNGEVQELSVELSPVQIEKRTSWIIGVNVDEMSELLQIHLGFDGAVITSLTEGGPAEKMGLKIHDIILEINGNKVGNSDQLREAVQASQGETLTIAVVRAGNKMTIELKPAEIEITSASSSPLADVRFLEDFALAHRYAPLIHNIDIADALLAPSSGTEQITLEDISRKLELLQQQVEELRESIEK